MDPRDWDPNAADRAELDRAVPSQRIGGWQVHRHTYGYRGKGIVPLFKVKVRERERKLTIARKQPWALDDWETNKATYIQTWEGLVQEVVSLGKSLSMPVAADLPFFAYKLNSSIEGQTADLWMLNVLDSATFMTYRTTATEVLELAVPVLAAGDASNTPVWLAVEAADAAEAAGVTFFDESASTLDAALTEIKSSSDSSASFNGIAVNGWLTLG